jgi:hypothetical protein
LFHRINISKNYARMSHRQLAKAALRWLAYQLAALNPALRTSRDSRHIPQIDSEEGDGPLMDCELLHPLESFASYR